jgi:excisionase family DNA binding protein
MEGFAAATARRPGCAPPRAVNSVKRPQSSLALKLSALSGETRNMPLSPAPSQSGGDRQLVFTSSQAARYLGVSLATIRRWTDAGHISCYRTPGGQRRFSREQLDEFVASMRRGGEARHERQRDHRAAGVA